MTFPATLFHYMPYKCKKTSLSCTIFYHFSPLWNVLYVINSYKRSIAAFDDVCLRVYWMDWMFTQPLNYGFFTVPFLIWHPYLPPTKYYIIYGNLRESEDWDEARPCIHFFFFFFPRGYFFVPRDDVVVLFAENSKLETLKNSTIISLWF